MTTLTLGTVTAPAREGYHVLGRLGAWHVPRAGWRAYFPIKWTGRVRAYEVDEEVTMPANSVLTVRPTTPSGLKPLEMPGYNGEDYRAGGGFWIDPYGSGTLLDHDRLMQRMAIMRYDVKTGTHPLRLKIPGYNLIRANDPYPKPFDSQHMIRGYRAAIRHLRDPFVRMDLTGISFDAGLAWNADFEKAILSMPAGRGHGACGREFAWVGYCAALARDRVLVQRMQRIARHVAQPWGGLLRQEPSWYAGSPNPWGAPPGGSNVPAGVPVAQGIECHMTVCALVALRLPTMALKLAETTLAKPLKKWIDANTGLGTGSLHADLTHAWIGLSAVAQHDPRLAVEYAKAWPIPTPGGSQVGPFSDLKKIRKALQDWGQLGKCRPFLEATA